MCFLLTRSARGLGGPPIIGGGEGEGLGEARLQAHEEGADGRGWGRWRQAGLRVSVTKQLLTSPEVSFSLLLAAKIVLTPRPAPVNPRLKPHKRALSSESVLPLHEWRQA